MRNKLIVMVIGIMMIVFVSSTKTGGGDSIVIIPFNPATGAAGNEVIIDCK